MKRLVAFVFFIFFVLNAYNQVIRGTIFDLKNKKPIYFASVYFNGTIVGTDTDDKGYFELDVSKYPSMPLTISALGYYTMTLTDYSFDETMVIYMTPKVFELKEVVISGKGLAWARKANMRLFRQSFLGTSPNASKTRILNEEDIHFIYNLESDTVKAYATKPLVIENGALGYTITYFLDDFEYDKKNDSFFFLGNIIFKEDLTVDSVQYHKFEKKRKAAYLGSKMHFFRALWNNDFKPFAFQIKDNHNKVLEYKDIVTEDDRHNKYLKYPGKLFIYYNSAIPVGQITVVENEVYFDKSGFFDPLNIVWSGLIAKQLIGDWLPYDYTIPDK